MKMKKVISVVLACACVFSFAACGSKSDSSKSDSARALASSVLPTPVGPKNKNSRHLNTMTETKLSESMQNLQQRSLTSLEWI